MSDSSCSSLRCGGHTRDAPSRNRLGVSFIQGAPPLQQRCDRLLRTRQELTMDEIKDILQTQLAGTIDFKGQELFDRYSNVIVYGGIALSVLVGFFLQDFHYFLVGIGATYVASLIFALPIPAYRRHPINWKDPTPVDTQRVQVTL